ncbi:hypothetical protein TSUD_408280 [Trifolium subterraneum]|uniref:Putative plant transposon protein domain-containing protein n=1 Tax=Trifolium subterraneum TaxID=3900 RepID=A0A2Z6PT52_TRISU|nr:hypothetical protein TSUD_408280 [Trifolium subterraneum]
MSGAGKKPVVDTTVHVLDQSDYEIDLLDKEIDDFELEPVTSTKSEPVKPKKSPNPKKKKVETAVKAPRTTKKVNLKKSKAKLLPAPLIQPEDEEIFDKYWKTKPVAVSTLYNFAELSIGGVDLVNFVEPFEWKSFIHIKETVYPLLVQAFYFNTQVFPEKDMITSNIKDVELVVDPYVIGSLIGIKIDGLEVYGNDWYDQVKISKEELKKKMFTEEGAKKNAPPSSILKTEYKHLHNMCQHSFFPRTGSKYKVTDLDLLMMYHMAKGVKLNLPYIILHHMNHVATSGFKKIALPYAMLLTRVFRLYYADMDNTPSENHYYTFSLKNVSHMKKVVETPAADVGVKRKRDVFEKTRLNVLADASRYRLENDLQTDGHTQISGDVDPVETKYVLIHTLRSSEATTWSEAKESSELKEDQNVCKKDDDVQKLNYEGLSEAIHSRPIRLQVIKGQLITTVTKDVILLSLGASCTLLLYFGQTVKVKLHCKRRRGFTQRIFKDYSCPFYNGNFSNVSMSFSTHINMPKKELMTNDLH